MADEYTELYRIIEKKIAASGYPGPIDGEEFYEDICEEAENKENGTYMFIVKKNETLSYQGCVTIFDEDMDLHYVDLILGAKKYHVDFDA